MELVMNWFVRLLLDLRDYIGVRNNVAGLLKWRPQLLNMKSKADYCDFYYWQFDIKNKK